jgi:hypothetical protein
VARDSPIDGAKFGMWPMGGAWLCTHLWDHYDYGRDKAYLASVYPLLKGASEFFLDVLVKDPRSGFLVTNPSMSPENNHGHGSSLCAGPAMDMEILRDLFDQTAQAASILGLDGTFAGQLRDTRAKLAPSKIGKAGQLQEWQDDWDMDARKSTIAMSATFTPCSPAIRSTSTRRRSLPPPPPDRWRSGATAPRAGPRHGASTSGRGWDRAIMPTASCAFCWGRSAPIPTCSTRIRLSRSTAISAAPRA